MATSDSGSVSITIEGEGESVSEALLAVMLNAEANLRAVGDDGDADG